LDELTTALNTLTHEKKEFEKSAVSLRARLDELESVEDLQPVIDDLKSQLES
jgi:hypothetical protein